MRLTLRLLVLLLGCLAFSPPHVAQAQTCATSTNTLDYSTVTTGSRMSATDVVGSTSATTSNYTTTVTGTNTNTFAVGANTALAASGNFLVWQQNDVGVNPATTPNISTVTYTFSRAVSNLTIKVTDIDADNNANNFIDRFTFDGYAAATGGTAITLTSSNVVVGTNATNQFVGSGSTATATTTPAARNNAVTGTASSDADRASDVTVTFPSPVTRLVVSYENIAPFKTATTNRTQTGGIVNMTWCRLAPTANAITNSNVVNTSGTSAVMNLSGTADGTIASYTLGTLPASTQGTLYVNGVAATAGQSLTPTQATQLTFAPNPSFTGTYSFSYTSKDDAGNVSSAATYAVPVTAGAAAPCANPGKDGSPTLTTNPNTYFPSNGAQTLASGANSIAVSAATGANTNIAAGDLLLVIQMQGADINATNSDSYGDGVAGGGASGNLTTNFTAGTYEYVMANSAVTASAGGTIQLASALKNSYVNANATTTAGQRRFQVVRVPQYSTLTLGGNITATPWNGTSGGIVVLDVAGQLNMGGFTIDASGAGFRGGAGRKLNGSTAAGLAGTDYRTAATLAVNGQKGEGTAGTPQYVNNAGALLDTGTDGYPSGSSGRGAPGNAGGGGTDTDPAGNSQNDGGGGGANGGAGGRGGNAWSSGTASGGEPGAAFSASSSRLVLGGGGGAGSTNDGTGTPNAGFASSGAAGGGLVIVRTGTVSGTGSILANGAAANNTVANDGSGGGGAGGSILLTAANSASLASANLTLAAAGGTGGTNTGGGVAHGPGGGGGGGVVLTNGSISSAVATAGANGTTYNNSAYGAAPGLTGTTNAQISNSIANSTAGSSCIADVATTITGPASANAGSTVSLSATFTNNGPLTATNVTRVVTLPGSAALTAAGISASGGTVTGDATNGYTITYPTLATLAANTPTSFTISYTAPAAGTIAATSTIGPMTGEGGLTANDVATVSTAINQIADVTTTLSGPATLSTDQLSGNYTATFTNNGPSTATSVSQKVTLPAGVTNVVLPTGATLTGSTIDFGTASTLNTMTSNSFVFSFTAPGTPGTSALTSNVTTTSNQGANAAADQATLNITVNKNTPPTNCAPSYFDGTNSYSGLSAEFYSGYYNGDPTYFNGKTPNLKRVDPNLNYGSAASFGDLTTSGASTANNTIFSARYRGSLSIATAGSYTFYLGSDDASNIWLDGAALAPTAGTSLASANYNAPKQFTLNLSAGLHNLTVYYGNGGGAANLTLEYSSTAGAGITRQIIPNSVLCAGMSNVPPIATNVTTSPSISSNAGPTALSSLAGTDQDGTVTNYVIATLPPAAQGTLRLNGVAVTTGQVITAAQAGQLTFQPVASFFGDNASNVTFTFSAIDNSGQYSNDVATYTIPVTPAADLTTALTGPATVVPGQPTGTYTATFTNEGTATASSVTRTVTLPAGATNVVLPAGATLSGSTINFGTATTLANGASSSFNFSFTPAATATGSLAITSNVGTTGTTSQGANTAPDASTITATVAPVADVATTLVANTTPVAAGTLATATNPAKFTVTFSNNGPTTANGVMETVQLPTGLTNVTISFPNGANGVSGSYNATTGVVTYSGATSIASGGTITSGIAFDAPINGPVAATSLISTTTNEAGKQANNTASATIAISPAFDLATTISGPTSAVPGDLVTLAVMTTNNGPSASPNAVQTVSLPQGLTNVYVSNGGAYNGASTAQDITVNGVTYSNVQPGQVVFPTIGSLPNGQSVANSVSFSQPASAYTPSSKVTTSGIGETNTANNTAYLNGATSSTPVAVATPATGTANAYTTISSSVPSTTVGSPITLTVVTGNNGPNAATGVTQTVQLLPGLTGVTISNSGTYSSTTGLVTFPTLATQASGTSVSNTITFNAPASTGNNGQLLAMAAVSTTNTDPVAADNVASVGVTLIQTADLASTVTGPASAQAGQPVTYTARFVNNGTMAATNVVETVQLPTGLGANAVTITDGNGNSVANATYSSTTGLVTFTTLGTDLNGAAQVYNLTFAAPAQNLTVRSNVTSATTDAALANNSATTTTTITGTADLATTVAGPATAVVGSAVTYSVTTTNNGPATATSAATTLQLATGFTTATLQVGGQTGTLSGNVITYGSGATASTYNTTTGLVTFPTVATQASGATTTNYVTFVMPSAAGGQTTGVASVSSATTDPASGNNTASVATSVAPTTTTSADITAAVTTTAPAGGVAPGATIAFTATYGNNGTDPALNVMPTLQLAPGLATTAITVAGQAGTLSNGLITFPNGAVYNVQSGVVTFPTIASQASGTANNVSYAVNVTAPGNGTVTAVAATTSNTSEPNTAAAQANDVASTSVSITPSFDEVTSLSGPVSAPVSTSANNSPVTYTVTTTNNGPSLTTGTTTQTVTLPAGLTATNISNGGTQSGTTITWTIPAGQAAGTNGAVANTFTILQPAGGATVTANVTSPGESNTANNTAYLNGATVATATTVTNLAPLAYAVVNTLQGPQSSDAGGLTNGLLISPLAASDPENSFATQKYTIVAAPDASQGTLYYNSTGTTYVAVASGQTLTDSQSKTLKFKAATGYVGNASFTYLATDAVGNPSPTVNYTLPIESDTEAPAYTVLPAKATAYTSGDVLAYTTDVNGAVNNATSASVYQADGTLQTGANNGITSAAAGTFTSSRSDVTSLTDLGITLDSNGRLVVTNPGTVATPNLRAGNYSVSVTTTDANGGITTQTVAFTIKANPLPVVLTAFTAQAVQNRDALLNWATASEQNSASFEIERSLDGSTFTKIGQVAAQGTSVSAAAYTFTDASIGARAQGSVYYRLRQLDLNGTAYYSPVRTVSFTKAAVVALSVYPNPATTSTVLDLSALPASASYQVLVLDATGRQVLAATQAGGLPQPLDLTSLASGTYNVLVTGKLADGSALRQTLRLIKE